MPQSFSFGRNWDRYIREHFSLERVETSGRQMREFLGKPVDGKSFLDIGCGSGIHSLAAVRAGASRVVSVDVDPLSIRATRTVRDMAGAPASWEVIEGSVLDAEFMGRLEPADVVYSWGVLHHTGDLWGAMRNAAGRVLPGGLFYIAIYEKTAATPYWIDVKRRYNTASPARRRLMEWEYVYRNFLRTKSPALLLKNLRLIRDYRSQRGMEFWTDIRDWLGGWPYEPATEEEVTGFCLKELGLSPMKIRTGEANIEYLFARGIGR